MQPISCALSVDGQVLLPTLRPKLHRAQAVASLLLGAAKLQRAIKVAAREAEGTGYEGLAPITAAFKVRGVRVGWFTSGVLSACAVDCLGREACLGATNWLSACELLRRTG